MDCDVTFNEIKCKEVVNTINGKKLGRAIDLVIDLKCALVLGLVLPGDKKLFKATDDLFIPWNRIVKIGDDVILVKIVEKNDCCPSIPPPKD